MKHRVKLLILLNLLLLTYISCSSNGDPGIVSLNCENQDVNPIQRVTSTVNFNNPNFVEVTYNNPNMNQSTKKIDYTE